MPQLREAKDWMLTAGVHLERAANMARTARHCERLKTIHQLRTEIAHQIEEAQDYLALTEPKRSMPHDR